jgi:hypothetical protein
MALCCVVVGCRSGQLSVQEAVTVLNQARDNGNVLSTTSLDFLMIEVGGGGPTEHSIGGSLCVYPFCVIL